MRLLLAAVLSATCALQGCLSNTSSDPAPAPIVVNESDAASLRAATDVARTLAVGSAVTLTYERKPEYKTIPYLAVDVIADATKKDVAPMQSISVQGKFPGTPRILVVDESYAIVAQSTAATLQADGTSIATVESPRAGTRTVLVIDKLWSLPMSFEVKVGN